MKILVAEDSDLTRQMTAMALRYDGHQVISADDGKEAVALYDIALMVSEPYDIVLLDLQMPVLDGTSAARAIRAMERERGIAPCRIMIMSGRVEKLSVEEIEELDISAVLEKPVKRERLAEMVGE